jgi:hypothetical protein
VNPTTTTGSVCINGDHDNGNNNCINSCVHAWADVQQQQLPYSALPSRGLIER